MRTSSGPSPASASAANSKLVESLVKIHHASELPDADVDLTEARGERQSQDSRWQAEWDARRERIHRKLEFIEQQLTELDASDDVEAPSFSLVGLPDESNR